MKMFIYASTKKVSVFMGKIISVKVDLGELSVATRKTFFFLYKILSEI